MAIRETAAIVPTTLNLRHSAKDAVQLAIQLESELREPLRVISLLADWSEHRQLAITAAYKVVDETAIFADATLGAVVVTLPASTSETINRDLHVKKTDVLANAVTITAQPGDLIDGNASVAIVTQGQSYHLLADGLGNWRILSTIAAASSGGLAVPATAAPIIVNFTAAAVGTSVKYAREDHRHLLDRTIIATGSDVWTGAHAWSPTANTAPITINKTASLTSAGLFRVLDTDGSPLVVADNIGRAGINCEPDAFLSIVGGALAPPILTNLFAWYRADSITTLSSGDIVPTWQDSSGNGNHLTAHGITSVGVNTPAMRPKWFPAGNAKAIPNLPSVSFEGDDIPDQIGYFTFDTGTIPLTVTAGWTIFLIWRDWFANSAASRILGVANTDLNDNFIYIKTTSSGGGLQQAATEQATGELFFSNNVAHTEGADTEVLAFRCAAGAGTLRAWVDGTLAPSTGNGGGPYARTSDVFFRYMGANERGVNSWTGTYNKSLVEMLIYNTALSDADVATVNTYLAARVAGSTTVTTYDLTRWRSAVGTVLSRIDAAGQFGFGGAPAYPIDVLFATAQQRLGVDTSNYFTTTVGATGIVTFNAVGAGQSFVFSDAVSAVGLSIWNAANTFKVTFDLASITADRVVTFPDATGTFGLLERAQTWTAVNTYSAQDVHNAGVSLGTSGILQSAVAKTGTTPGCTIRNSIALGVNNPLLSVQRWTGSAYEENFQVTAMGPSGGSNKRIRVLYDASNYFEVSVNSGGTVTQTAVGTIGGMSFAMSGTCQFGGSTTTFASPATFGNTITYQNTAHTSSVAAASLAYTFDTSAARTGGVAAYKFSDNAAEIISFYPALVDSKVDLQATVLTAPVVNAKFDATHYIQLAATGSAEQTILLPTGTSLSIDKAVLFKSQVASSSIAFRRSDLGTGTYGASFDLTSTTVTLNTNHDPAQVQGGLVVQQVAAGSAGSKIFRVSNNAALVSISCDQNGDVDLGASGKKMSLFGVAAVIQPAGALQAALTNSTGGSQDGTLVDVATAGLADPAKINSNFTDVYALLDAMRTAMVNLGSMKGAA